MGFGRTKSKHEHPDSVYLFMLNCNTRRTRHNASSRTQSIIPHLLIYIDDRHINHARAPQRCYPDPRCRPETYCPGPGLQVDGSLLRTTAVSTYRSVPTPPNLQPSHRSPETRRHSRHGESQAGANITTYLRPQRCECRFHHNIGARRFVSQGRVTAGRLGRERGWRCAVLANEIGINSGPPTCLLKERSEGRGFLDWDDSGRAPHYCETRPRRTPRQHCVT